MGTELDWYPPHPNVSVNPTTAKAGWETARLPWAEEPRGDPGKRVAIEEAPQLPTGKRVVSQHAFPQTPVTETKKL